MNSDKERREAFEQLNQNYIRELSELAKLCQAKADWHLAQACYQQILRLQPQEKSILCDDELLETDITNNVNSSKKPQYLQYIELGNIYQKLQQPEQALTAYQKALAIKPNQPAWVYQSLGNIYQKLQHQTKSDAS